MSSLPNRISITRQACVLVLCALLANVAMAHNPSGVAGGFASGFLHPLTGWDHIMAMVAVGIWGALLGGAAIWVLPVAFPLVMAMGGAMGVVGVPLGGVEAGIAVSALLLGFVIATRARPPLWIAASLVSAFAICHGYAHGVELPHAADPVAYGAGFVLATGLLHVCGITLGLLQRWPTGLRVLRLTGAGISLGGVVLLAQQMV
jgi:urease accessory protein